ncbi:glycosyltransferase family 2 protein [Desulfonatronospira sp.]|uniref:glycosyltransferase family 2 protein n=1 Tax=Desulfonatronospira sp. TaxID=1962951 RepID=UPI0025C5D6A8|nr:glycosyltransferase family 2 protein [Desulfonatronospira sp.]
MPNSSSDELCVAVILSVHNGQAYLVPQLDSILGQTWQDFTLYIRDDGSTDNSPAILQEYARKDSRIRLIKTPGGNLGLTPSLKILLQAVRAQIIFFADQDDHWLPHKIQTMISSVPKSLNTEPWVAFSDLEVTDSQLNTVYPSFWSLAKINPEKTSFRHIVRRNCVTGCACAINRRMLQLVQEMPDQALHDWWLASLASLQGRLIPVRAPLVRYRQHDNNAIGAQQGGLGRARTLLNKPGLRKSYCRQLESSLDHLLELARIEPIKRNLFRSWLIKIEICKRKCLKKVAGSFL